MMLGYAVREKMSAGTPKEHQECARVRVLPAFGDFTGFADVPVMDGDQVWVIAEPEVREVTGAAGLTA
ncbi:MAG: hypothetical protein ACT4P6_00560 [Gemmatimonadaceae bacterium]